MTVDLRSIAADPNGGWFFGGCTAPFTSEPQHLMVGRIGQDGTLDTSFGTDGFTDLTYSTSSFGGDDACQVAVDDQGGIRGHATTNMGAVNGAFTALIAARLDANGGHDLTYGNAGWYMNELGVNGSLGLHGFFMPPSGATLALVHHTTTVNGGMVARAALVQLAADGSAVPDFGTNGVVDLDMVGGESRIFVDAAWHGTDGMVLVGQRQESFFPEFDWEGLVFRLGTSVGLPDQLPVHSTRPVCGTVRAGEARVSLPLNDGAQVHWSLFDMAGRETVFNKVPGRMEQGATTIRFPAELGTGIYLLQVRSDQGDFTLRCLVE